MSRRIINSDSSWPVLIGAFVVVLLMLAGIPALLSYLGVQPDSRRPVPVERIEQQEDFDPFGIGLDNPLAPTLYPDLYPGW